MSSSGGADADDNGVEDWMRVVHTHQKEAIYRQMLEYKREFKSADARLREFRAQQRRCEASENAMEACWSQVCGISRTSVRQVAAIVSTGS
jgi:E3 ubiquitin-protein ligase BRE1